MTEYKCPNCEKHFSQKSHLDTHLNKKKTCKKCSKYYESQYAYINDKYINIKDYKKNKNDKIKCHLGHELIMCNGKKIKPYFRHKNTEDVEGKGTGKWHCMIQGFFPLIEQKFDKLQEEQIKDRRADIVIPNYNYIVEVQHSHISDSEVICRNKDYSLHNMKLIWIIDGNTEDIEFEELTSGYLIIFKEPWKYKSFIYTYDFIILNIDNKMFRIPLKKISNRMILLKEWKSIEYIVDKLLENPSNIWKEWNDDDEVKAKMTIYQKAAGNGKTFGIWQNIFLNNEKEIFIILIKQHSARDVLLNELKEQEKRKEIHIIKNCSNFSVAEEKRKYIIEFIHNKSNKNYKVIIGTIDSFNYNLSSINELISGNYFNDLVKDISNNGLKKLNKKNNSVKYGNKNINLDRKTVIWIDEAQDLDINYFNSLVKIMLETKIDVNIVGDKLQSLENEINIMTCVEKKIPNIDIIPIKNINENRRIKVTGMLEIINKLVNFNKFDLPVIRHAPEIIDKLIIKDEEPIEIIETDKINNNFNNEVDNDKRFEFVNKIIELVEKEVNKNNYKPEDFLFIFPIMKSNLTAIELETKLNDFWIKKLHDSNKYKNYAFLHKHEDGKVIDLKLSNNSSRIVTIKTSKGDGRKVVFILDCNELSLKIAAKTNDYDLVYESHFHVPLTRAEEKTYFFLEKNNDEIYRRFRDHGLTEYIPNIKVNININDIINNINKKDIIELIKNNNITDLQIEKNDFYNIEPIKPIIDWEYHCIKRAIYLQYAVFNILKYKNNNFEKSQISTILKNIYELKIKPYETKDFYLYLKSLGPFNNLDVIPTCKLSNKIIYKNYYEKISNIIEKNKDNCYKKPLSIKDMNPLEAVIQWYIIELYRHNKFCMTSPMTIYNIVNFFEKEEDNKVVELLSQTTYIKNIIDKVMLQIYENDDKIKWNIEHIIKYNGKSQDIKLTLKDLPIIGYSNNYVYHMKFCSDFNKLNYCDIIIELILERFIINNPKNKGKDIDKFENKPIKTYLFNLNKNEYELFEWNFNETLFLKLKEIINDSIIKYYSYFNKQIFQYLTFIKNKKEIWKDYNNPFNYISKKDEFENIVYIKDFFKNLDRKSKINKNEVLEIINSEYKFYDEINFYIKDMCDTYFGLNININLSDEEW
jgi:hypothetical protein